MAGKQKGLESVEWSIGSHRRIQLYAMAPERVCHNYCTRHSEEDQQQRSIQMQRKQALPVNSNSGCEGMALAYPDDWCFAFPRQPHILCVT
jgi:hypothetical protein